MTGEIVLSSSSLTRRHPLLASQTSSSSSSSSGSTRFAEVAGVTTAECAAICCCPPCGLVNLVLLTVYKVPACLLRRVIKKRRNQKMVKKGILPVTRRKWYDETDAQIHPTLTEKELLPAAEEEKEKEVVELEKEMWNRFYGTGFWRSPSQRD